MLPPLFVVRRCNALPYPVTGNQKQTVAVGPQWAISPSLDMGPNLFGRTLASEVVGIEIPYSQQHKDSSGQQLLSTRSDHPQDSDSLDMAGKGVSYTDLPSQ